MTTLSLQVYRCTLCIHVMRITLVLLMTGVMYQSAGGRTLRSAACPEDTLYTLHATSWTGSLCDVITPCVELSIPRRILRMSYNAELDMFPDITILLTVMVDSLDTIRTFSPRLVKWRNASTADSGKTAMLEHVGKHLKGMVGKSRIVRPPGFQRELGRSIWSPLRIIYMVLQIGKSYGIPHSIPEKGSNAFWYYVPDEAFR